MEVIHILSFLADQALVATSITVIRSNGQQAFCPSIQAGILA
jgi:hypothetical protein